MIKKTENHELTEESSLVSHKMQSNSVQYFISMETHLNLLILISRFKWVSMDEIYNLLTKSVMNETVTNDILHCDEIGQQMFEDFVTERLTEEKLSV